ncbi:MAG: polysaccharide biosynthesis C-terminal domain-containing protein, partial [Clostridia bacterium]|nr:polysaccharide biosynthesis C-terminal domain-containing protein [Clostridia bacterium]
FTALCTFLGSVYFASKKTMGSMLTALAGAVLNVALNLLLIPPFGAMGASVATFASYFAVSLLRLATGRRLIPFKGEWGRLMVNTLLMGVLTAVVTLSEGDILPVLLMYGAAAGIFVTMLAFNARAIMELLKDGKRMLRGR